MRSARPFAGEGITMTKTGTDIIIRLALLGAFTAVLVGLMAACKGPAPEDIRVIAIDIGETVRAYIQH